MKRGKLLSRAIWGGVVCALLLGAPASQGAAPRETTLQIGVLNTVFHGLPESMVKLIARPLQLLMKAQTGMRTEIRVIDSPKTLATLLKANELHLGVMHGFELGWGREVNPELKPLVIAVGEHVQLRACMVVRKDSDINRCGDLKGKKIALPRRSRAHCKLYLERRCAGVIQPPGEYFAVVETPALPRTALDNVVRGSIDAALVEEEALEELKERDPKGYAELRVLQKSEAFPAGVFVYHPGNLAGSTLERFRSGMKKASSSMKGRQMLRMSRISKFLDVPKDYENNLKEIVEAYPQQAPVSQN